jgi:hypothetical protein
MDCCAVVRTGLDAMANSCGCIITTFRDESTLPRTGHAHNSNIYIIRATHLLKLVGRSPIASTPENNLKKF